MLEVAELIFVWCTVFMSSKLLLFVMRDPFGFLSVSILQVELVSARSGLTLFPVSQPSPVQ